MLGITGKIFCHASFLLTNSKHTPIWRWVINIELRSALSLLNGGTAHQALANSALVNFYLTAQFRVTVRLLTSLQPGLL
jgi:hypothetical protein